jgi:putative tryptophan/tyrosine transport system substrate-binding protein
MATPSRKVWYRALPDPAVISLAVTIFGTAAVAKRVQLLLEVLPQASVVGFLMNPTNPDANTELEAAQAAAASRGKELLILGASSDDEIDTAFASVAQRRDSVMVGATDTFLFGRRDKLVSLASHYRIPAIYFIREFAEAGGLMAYGNRITETYRQVGIYVGRILKGEKPADLPVVQATTYEFLINLKTAKALGLSIPSGVMSIADEVIE